MHSILAIKNYCAHLLIKTPHHFSDHFTIFCSCGAAFEFYSLLAVNFNHNGCNKWISAFHLFRETPCHSWYSYKDIFFILSAQNTEERLHNLTTQPCLKLLCNDPYKSVSVAQRRWVFKTMPLLGKFSLKAHVEDSQRSQIGGENELILSHCQFFFPFFVWTVGCGAVGLSLSFFISI